MSAAQSRSWRSQRHGRRRNKRRGKLVVAGAVLALLVGALLWFLLRPPVPATHFVSWTDASNAPSRSGLQGKSVPIFAVNEQRFMAAFQALSSKNPNLVASPRSDVDQGELRSALQGARGERLILYCGVEGSLTLNEQQQPVVLLGAPTASGRRLTLSQLLEEIRQLDCPTSLLILEFTGQEPGIASGAVASNLMQQVRRVVASAAVPGLSTLCAFDSGERSWEYLSGADTGLPPAAAASEADEAGDQSLPEVPLGVYAGTAFGHFLVESLLAGDGGTPRQLHRQLRSSVEDWVAATHGERQSVLLLPDQADTGTERLLDSIRLPAPEPQAAEAEGDSGAEAGDSTDPEVAGADAGNSVARELQQRLAERDRLLREGLVPVTQPELWVTLQSRLFHAAQALLYSDVGDHFRQNLTEADKILSQLRAVSARSEQGGQPEVIDHWLCGPAESTDEELASAGTLVEDLITPALPESSIKLSSAQKQPAFMRAVTRAVVDRLQAELQDLDRVQQAERDARLARCDRLVSEVARAGWSSAEWPHQMDTLISVRGAVDDGDWDPRLWIPLLELIQLRERVLLSTVGRYQDGAPIRDRIWRSHVEGPAGEVLTRLVAAESWLRLGSIGGDAAIEQIRRAAAAYDQLRDSAEAARRRQVVEDAQYYPLPGMVEFMASVQEQVPLTETALQSAREMAQAIVNNQPVQEAFPPGFYDEQQLAREQVNALFALTDDFGDTGPVDTDLRDYNLLLQFVQQRVAGNPSGWERYQLLQLPLVAQFGDRAALVDSLVKSTQAPVVYHDRSSLENSGIWMGFWSIRLLSALGVDNADVSRLWSEWGELVNTIELNQPASGLEQQIRLADSLRQVWDRHYQERLNAAATAHGFVAVSSWQPLLVRELRRRAAVASDSYAIRRVMSELGEPERSLTRAEIIHVDAEYQRVAVSDSVTDIACHVSESGRVLLLSPGFRLVTPRSAGSVPGGWRVLPSDTPKDDLLRLQLEAEAPVSGRSTVSLVAVDRDQIVIDRKDIAVFPSTVSDADIAFRTAPDGDRIDVIADRPTVRQLNLPSNSRVEFEQQSVSLIAELRRTTGPERFLVQLFQGTSDSTKPVWPAPREFVTSAETGKTQISLWPPPDATAANPAEGDAAPQQLDLSSGFHFTIAPQHEAFEVPTRRIDFKPAFFDPDRYLQEPEPRWQPPESDQLVIEISRALQPSYLAPDKVPVSVQMSPWLESLVQQSSQPIPHVPIGAEQPLPVRLQFGNELRAWFESGGRAGQRAELSVSVAGIPQAWRWEIGPDGARLLNRLSRPQVRAQLEVLNKAEELKPVMTVPELRLGTGWRKAQILVQAQIVGGRLAAADDWKLKLEYRRLPNGPYLPLLDQRIGAEAFQRTVQAESGEGEVWLLFTETALRGKVLPLAGLADGRHEVLATLKSGVPGDSSIRDRIEFVVDSTPPDINSTNPRAAAMLAQTLVGEPLVGRIRVQDPESNVEKVEVGLTEELGVTAEAVDESGQVFEFQIQPAAFPESVQQLQPGAAPRLGRLYVSATNGVGLSAGASYSVKFSVAAAPDPEPMKPELGVLRITNRGGSKFQVRLNPGSSVRLKPPNDQPQALDALGTVAFADLEPGIYKVVWSPDGGGGRPKERLVGVRSGENSLKIP